MWSQTLAHTRPGPEKSQSAHNGAWPDLHAQRRWTKQARSPQMHFLPSLLFCVALVLCSCIACPLCRLCALLLYCLSSGSPNISLLRFCLYLMRFALLWDSRQNLYFGPVTHHQSTFVMFDYLSMASVLLDLWAYWTLLICWPDQPCILETV